MPYIEWNEPDMKVRKNFMLDASVFMEAWKINRHRDGSFSGLINDLLREWVETENEGKENALPA